MFGRNATNVLKECSKGFSVTTKYLLHQKKYHLIKVYVQQILILICLISTILHIGGPLSLNASFQLEFIYQIALLNNFQFLKWLDKYNMLLLNVNSFQTEYYRK